MFGNNIDCQINNIYPSRYLYVASDYRTIHPLIIDEYRCGL